jgi:hypothetical protein
MLDGAPARTRMELAKAAGFSDNMDGLIWSTVDAAVLPAGKELTFVQAVDDEPRREMFRALLLGRKHSISMTVCYCSVLDDCWVAGWVAGLGVARNDDTKPSNGSCPVAATERFTQ